MTNTICTKTTPKCLTGDNGIKKAELGGLKSGYTKPCCVNAIKETCFYLIDLFAENGIKYWLDFGTLLGAARTGEIIPWDKDADVGILQSDEKKLLSLEKKISEDGFYFSKRLKGIYRINYSKINLNFVDIFTWELCTPDYAIKDPRLGTGPKPEIIFKHGFLYGVAGVLNHIHKSFPYYFIENTVPLKFYNKMAQAPQNYEKFLEMRFGTQWKIPKRGWVTKNFITSTEIEEWCVKEKNWNFKT